MLVFVTTELALKDFVRVAARNLYCVVSRSRIANDNLIRPDDRFAGGGDVVSFVVDVDFDGDFHERMNFE